MNDFILSSQRPQRPLPSFKITMELKIGKMNGKTNVKFVITDSKAMKLPKLLTGRA
jgi:hypothetical protein